MKNPISLTPADWQEIYSALGTKAHDIGNGDLGGNEHWSSPNGCHPDCEACENPRWIAHLENIMEKIGDDGAEAILKGVEACPVDRPNWSPSEVRAKGKVS